MKSSSKRLEEKDGRGGECARCCKCARCWLDCFVGDECAKCWLDCFVDVGSTVVCVIMLYITFYIQERYHM